ncbi:MULTISPECIES: hypothetical protein [Flavobacterium]|uniref:YhhN-like protein n=1 Tax=Flavobacterium hankyongi TaxID=1176532 RepID=A0ABP8ZWX8_9FLAO|nr:hypothetical protein [Flavobacterium sp. N1846]
MITKNISIYLYVVASILAVIAMIFDNEWLMLFVKPSIIPALFIHYITLNKSKISKDLLAILSIYFISDVITLLEIEEAILYIMALDFLPYILLLKVVTEDVFELKLNKLNLGIVLGAFSGLMFAMYYLVQSFVQTNPDFILPVIVYGIILALYVSLSLYLYLETDFDFAFDILIAALFALIADVIFVITNMIFKADALNYIEFAFQIISYFFIVAYFLKRNIYRNTKSNFFTIVDEV